MSSPSASSTGPNLSTASVRSTVPTPSSPSTSTATQQSATNPASGTSNSAPQSTTPTNPTTTTQSATQPNPQLTAQAHAALTTTLTSLGNKHLSPLQSRAQDIQSNATQISTQQAALDKNSTTLAKDSNALEKEAGKAGEVLKGLGDLQNWAEVMEWELGVLERTMDQVEGVAGESDEEEWVDEGVEEDEEEGDGRIVSEEGDTTEHTSRAQQEEGEGAGVMQPQAPHDEINPANETTLERPSAEASTVDNKTMAPK